MPLYQGSIVFFSAAPVNLEPTTHFLFSCFRKNNTAVLQNTVCVGSTAKSQLGRRTHLGRLPPSSPYWRNVARHCCKICIPGMGLLNSDHHMSGVISSRALASDYVASTSAIELTDLLFQPIFACENASLSELQYLFREVQTSHLLWRSHLGSMYLKKLTVSVMIASLDPTHLPPRKFQISNVTIN